MNQAEYDEYNQTNTKMEEKIQTHLSKFNDLGFFMNQVDSIVLFYFQNQSKTNYSSIGDFKIYIIEGIKKYIKYLSYSGPRNGLLQLESELQNFDEDYDKIIYFGEYNPVEAVRKEREAEKAKIPALSETLNPKTQGVIGGVTGVVRKLLGNK